MLHLPNNEKAVNIAFDYYDVLVLGQSGQVFIPNIVKGKGALTQSFIKDDSLDGIKIIQISGVDRHYLKITVFLRAGIMKAAYAGAFHSLFQTVDGAILACGGQSSGEIPGVNPTKDSAHIPIETSIKSGVTLCIAGCSFSAFFFGVCPPRMPNRTVNFDEGNPEKCKNEFIDFEEENIALKAEIEKLRKENEQLRSKLKESDFSTERNQDKKEKNVEIMDQKTIDEMTRINKVGQGPQSQVYKVSRPQEFALKVMNVGESTESDNFENLRKFVKELDILKILNHRNIVQIFGFCFGNESNAPSMLMQYCPSNLSDIIKSLDDCQKVCVIYEISLGMEAVHAKNLIHRDLKPTSILIDEERHVRLSDFGKSCLVDSENANQSLTAGIGTMYFMAPELLNESTHYTNKVDVYSFGVIVYFILTGGSLPKINLDDQSKGKKAVILKSINAISRDLISRCWSKEPKERPSFSEIIEIIKKNNFNLIDGDDFMIEEIRSFLSL